MQELAKKNLEMGKPVLAFNLLELERNIDDYYYFKNKYQVSFLFPVKAFPSRIVLDLFYKKGFGFEISNQNEYDLVKKYKKATVIVNDPLGKFNLAKEKSINIVSSTNKKMQYPVGIRVNFNEDFGKSSHFGILRGSLSNIELGMRREVSCIHFHIANIKTENNLKIVLKGINDIVGLFPQMKYIDIGGNWDNKKHLLEYFLVELRYILDNKVGILVEAGEFWFKNVGYAIGQAKMCYEQRNSKVVLLNLSKILHCDWSSPEFKKAIPERQVSPLPVKLFGPTCYELDAFQDAYVNQDIQEGDIVVLRNINGYSFALNKSFNGIDKAEVIFYYGE